MTTESPTNRSVYRKRVLGKTAKFIYSHFLLDKWQLKSNGQSRKLSFTTMFVYKLFAIKHWLSIHVIKWNFNAVFNQFEN